MICKTERTSKLENPTSAGGVKSDNCGVMSDTDVLGTIWLNIGCMKSDFCGKKIQKICASKWLNLLIFSCDQAALQMVFSVRLSVCPSVCLSVCPSLLFDYVPIIVSSWNFQELLPMTNVRSMQKVKVRGQRSRSQRSQPNLTVSGL